jgi:hypothetical protein
MIDYADKDRDGVINYDEFINVITKEYPKVWSVYHQYLKIFTLFWFIFSEKETKLMTSNQLKLILKSLLNLIWIFYRIQLTFKMTLSNIIFNGKFNFISFLNFLLRDFLLRKPMFEVFDHKFELIS